MSRRDDDRVKLRPRTMYLLYQANQAVRTQIEQELRSLNLTGIQYTVLSIVGAHDGISSAQLSRRFFVTPQTMNEIVSGLERRGLLRRQASPGNRRILTAMLTSKGEEILKASDRIADRIEADAFAQLSDKDFKGLRRILGHLLSSLRTARGAMEANEAVE